jgi:hypothetical protein
MVPRAAARRGIPHEALKSKIAQPGNQQPQIQGQIIAIDVRAAGLIDEFIGCTGIANLASATVRGCAEAGPLSVEQRAEY